MIVYPTLSNGSQTITVPGGIQGLCSVTYACQSFPIAGTVKLEYQTTASSQWNLAVGSNGQTSTQQASVQASWEVYGPISAIRLTFAGLSGGSGCALAVMHMENRGHPFGVYQGIRALTVQDYNSTNSKRGVQYEASTVNASIAAGGTLDILMVTGAQPVIIKNRIVDTTSTLGEYHKYKSPTAVQGSAIPVYNMNTNPSVAVPNTMQLYLASSVSATGTEIAAPLYVVGTSGNGQSVIGTYQSAGNERILQANTTYLARFKNTGAGTCVVAVSFLWFEGQPDLPLN